MTKAPIQITMERQRKVARIIRACLQPFGHDQVVEESALHVKDRYIVENAGGSHSLSTAILDTMFPHEPTPCLLFHYTSLESLQSIAASSELRLYAVRKRIGQGELDTFAKAHGLLGYLDVSQGQPFYKELSDDLFYVSLTRSNGSDPNHSAMMWAVFAKGTGARLTLKITPKNAELRSIQYAQLSPKTLLNEINQALAGEGEPPFVPWTISRIGAFYLPCTVQIEDEVRLLMKRYNGGLNPVQTDGTHNYWPVPIGVKNDVCDVEVIGITAAPNADRSALHAAIAGTAFAKVPFP